MDFSEQVVTVRVHIACWGRHPVQAGLSLREVAGMFRFLTTRNTLQRWLEPSSWRIPRESVCQSRELSREKRTFVPCLDSIAQHRAERNSKIGQRLLPGDRSPHRPIGSVCQHER